MFPLLALIIACLTQAASTAPLHNPCLERGTLPHEDGGCYGFESELKTWNDANQYCQRNGGHLAKVTTSVTQRFLAEKMPKNMSYWIGARRQKRWTWENGDVLMYFDWFPGEPSSPNEIPEDHIMLWAGDNLDNRRHDIPSISGGYKWNDNKADRIDTDGVISKFICEIETLCTYLPTSLCNPNENRCVQIDSNCYYFGGKYAQFSTNGGEGVTWEQARNGCKKYVGSLSTLARVTDKTIQDGLVAAIKRDKNSQGNYWIGATWDQETLVWLWESGGFVDYSNWQKDVPVNYPGEQCALMKYSLNASIDDQFKWNKEICSSQKPFICQYANQCGKPPRRGENSYGIGNDDQTINSQLTFRCYEGYSLAENSSLIVTCLGNGEWSSLPVCLPTTTSEERPAETTTIHQNSSPSETKLQSVAHNIRCGVPPQEGSNSYWIGHATQTIHSKLTFRCYGGYSLAENSSLTVQCLGTGEWSSLPVCLPTTTSTESITKITTRLRETEAPIVESAYTPSTSGSDVTPKCVTETIVTQSVGEKIAGESANNRNCKCQCSCNCNSLFRSRRKYGG